MFIKAIWTVMGPCQLAGFLLSPLTLSWLLVSGMWYCRPDSFSKATCRLALAVLLVGTGALLAITPFAVEDDPGTLNQMHWQYCPVRYGLCFLSISVFGMLLLMEDGAAFLLRSCLGTAERHRVPRPSRLCFGLFLLPQFVLAFAVLLQLFQPGWQTEVQWTESFLIAASLVLIVASFSLIHALMPKWRTRFAAGLAAVAILGGSWGCQVLANRWHQGFARHYDQIVGGDCFVFVEDRPGPREICVLHSLCYPFFGSRRQCHVCQPVYAVSPEWLMSYFERQRVDLVVTGARLPYQGASQFQWFDLCLAKNPTVLSKLRETPILAIFAVDWRHLDENVRQHPGRPSHLLERRNRFHKAGSLACRSSVARSGKRSVYVRPDLAGRYGQTRMRW